MLLPFESLAVSVIVKGSIHTPLVLATVHLPLIVLVCLLNTSQLAEYPSTLIPAFANAVVIASCTAHAS